MMKTKKGKMSRASQLVVTTSVIIIGTIATITMAAVAPQTSLGGPFPGVSRELAPFCAARPSLPIDLASMVVHVKKNTLFNYKLYLFSGEHVFQTGQVIPRDDFRIHSFPVKLKKLDEFWPTSSERHSPNTYKYLRNESGQFELVGGPHHFRLANFLAPVPLNPVILAPKKLHSKQDHPQEAFSLPGEEPHHSSEGTPFISHDVEQVMGAKTAASGHHNDDMNWGIEFDRDDQVSVARLPAYLSSGLGQTATSATPSNNKSGGQLDAQSSIVPVGSFSSFHVNISYLVRKDFGQVEPELVKIQVDAQQFRVTELVIISDGQQSAYPHHDDYTFLQHRLLRDPNTRITSINQIYEDWITRNLYTIVYIQRKLEQKDDSATFVTDRLIFRGTSTSLLGADQLDYAVKAAAFITEKNGLHYYLEFLTNSKFYLCAIDWTKRPFKIIDSQRFPIKATKTQLDNEELLLCPPAVCYSSEPVDELVAYGRLSNTTTTGSQQQQQQQLEVRLHLRDWQWPLARGSLSSKRASKGFTWRYESGRRNDIKAKPDTYGYPLTGHEIDASYRLQNELYLISSNHLITINYTLANETVTSTQPVGDEWPGLSSSLLEPITGAFYDRHSNQIFFFKGDRYIGFDYATKRPLEDFRLLAPAALAEHQMLVMEPPSQQQQQLLLSSLPVVGILGRQHPVDGVYHDLATDLVYIFVGMKFYTLSASDFKNGSFASQSLPPMLCINELLLDGCHFDRAYPNPCTSEQAPSGGKLAAADPVPHDPKDVTATFVAPKGDLKKANAAFRDEQQMRLRSIATGRRLFSRLLGAPGSLLHSSGPNNIEATSTTEPASLSAEEWERVSKAGDEDRRRIVAMQTDRLVIYLLIGMVGMTVFISIIMIVVIIGWTRAAHRRPATTAAQQLRLASLVPDNSSLSNLSHLYLRNQQVQQQQQQHQRKLASQIMNNSNRLLIKPTPASIKQAAKIRGSDNNGGLAVDSSFL